MEKNYMIKAAAVTGLILASLAAAGYAADFDGRTAGDLVSLKQSVMDGAGDIKVPAAKATARAQGRHDPEVSCYNIRLIDKDGTSPSWWANLTSSYEEKYWQQDEWGHNSAYWEYVRTDHARAELNIGYRQLRDGESENFKLCYDFVNDKGTYSIDSPFEYKVESRFLPNNQTGYALTLTPLGRKNEAPSAGLLQLSSFSYDDMTGMFTLKLATSFPAYYNGNKVHVGVELVQDKLFDSSLGVKFFEFDIASYEREYTAKFKLADFGGNKEAQDRAKTKKYFVKWGFKVKGEGFTDDYIDGGKTSAVTVLQ